MECTPPPQGRSSNTCRVVLRTSTKSWGVSARAMLEREEARHTTLSRNAPLEKKRSGFIISRGQVEKV